jgi:hypothetical protein
MLATFYNFGRPAFQYSLTRSLLTSSCKVLPLSDISWEVSFTYLRVASLPRFIQKVVELNSYADQ